MKQAWLTGGAGMAMSGGLANALTKQDVDGAVSIKHPSDVTLACTAQDLGGSTQNHKGFKMDIVDNGHLNEEIMAVHAQALYSENRHTGAAQVQGTHTIPERERMMPLWKEEVELDGKDIERAMVGTKQEIYETGPTDE